MTFRRIQGVVAIVAAFSVQPSAAQTTIDSYRDSGGQIRSGQGVGIISPIRAASTTTAGTITTANTFQSALAASISRKGCAVYNTSTAAQSIYLGSPGNATPATSIPLPAGGSFNCGSFQGLVLTDQISIASATAGASFVVVSQ